MHVLRRPKFVQDLTEAYAYLAERNQSAADGLLDEVELVVELLASFPDIGRPRNELQIGVRSFRLRRYRHIVFYRHANDAVELLRILHGATDLRSDLLPG